MINIDEVNPFLSDGMWTEFDGSEFLVRHMSSVEFQRAVMRRQAPYKQKIERGTLDPKVTRELMSKAMGDALVLGWRKVLGADGQEVPFSPEACYKALMNHEELRDFISNFSMDLDNFREEKRVEMGKP